MRLSRRPANPRASSNGREFLCGRKAGSALRPIRARREAASEQAPRWCQSGHPRTPRLYLVAPLLRRLLPQAASAMTTPGGVFIRRSEFDDQPGIQALIGQEAEQVAKRFRHVDVTNMIENASLGITAVDEKGAVVGYAAFYDFPALTSEVDPVAWPEWLHGAYGHPEFTGGTAFLSFFPADPPRESEVLENILRTAFTTPRRRRPALPAAARVKLFAGCGTLDALKPLGVEEEEVAVRAYACRRAVPDLLIREARVEDRRPRPASTRSSRSSSSVTASFHRRAITGDEANARSSPVDGASAALALARVDIALLQQCFDLSACAAPPRAAAAARPRARPRACPPASRGPQVRRADEAGRGGAAAMRAASSDCASPRRRRRRRSGRGQPRQSPARGHLRRDRRRRLGDAVGGRAEGAGVRRTRHDAVEWLDADGDGQLTCDEFCYALSAHVMEGEDEEIVVVADERGAGLIKRTSAADEPADADAPLPDPEAAAAKEAAAEASASAKERGAELLGKVYAQIDVNKSGSISASELKAALGAHSAELTLDWLDASGDGALTKEEFIEGALQNFGVIEELMEQAPIFAKLRTALEGVRAAVDDDLAARTTMGADAPAAAIQRRASFGMSRCRRRRRRRCPAWWACRHDLLYGRGLRVAREGLPRRLRRVPRPRVLRGGLAAHDAGFALLNHQAEAPSSSFGHRLPAHRDAHRHAHRPRAAPPTAPPCSISSTVSTRRRRLSPRDGATAEAAEGRSPPLSPSLGAARRRRHRCDGGGDAALQAGVPLEDLFLHEHQPAAHVGRSTCAGRSSHARHASFARSSASYGHRASTTPSTPAAIPPILSGCADTPAPASTLSPALLSELAEQRGVDADPQPEPVAPCTSLRVISGQDREQRTRCRRQRLRHRARLLESLLTVPYLFASLTSSRPARAKLLTAWRDGSDLRLPSSSRARRRTRRRSSPLALGGRRIVDARIADIERQRKAVATRRLILPYDHLVLAPELGDASFVALGPEAAGVRGAFSLCDDDAIASAALYLDGADAAARGAAVVCGAGVDAYAALAALIAAAWRPRSSCSSSPPARPPTPSATRRSASWWRRS